jgi:uncharacterized protein GlcG (DUF336 family)
MSEKLTLSDAQRVINAGIVKAGTIGQPMNIAVVDAGARICSPSSGWMGDSRQYRHFNPEGEDIDTDESADAELTELVQPGASLYGLEQTAGGLVTFGGGCCLNGMTGWSARWV